MSDGSELLGKGAILAQSGQRQDAYVMAFGGRCRVVELNAHERDALDIHAAKVAKAQGEDAARNAFSSIWVMHTLVGDDGQRVFADGDLDAVMRLSARDIRRLFKVAARLNGILGDEDDDGDSVPN